MDRSVLEQIDPRVLGARLQDARKVAGLTQQAVAEPMGMARTTIVAIEKGDRRVTVDELLSLAKLYGRQVSEFVSRRAVTESFVPQFRATDEISSTSTLILSRQPSNCNVSRRIMRNWSASLAFPRPAHTCHRTR